MSGCVWQAKKSAAEAAHAASEGAQLALEAVEASVQQLVAVRDYSRLKDMAEASAVAGQVLRTAQHSMPPARSHPCNSNPLPAARPRTNRLCMQPLSAARLRVVRRRPKLNSTHFTFWNSTSPLGSPLSSGRCITAMMRVFLRADAEVLRCCHARR